MVYLKGQLSKMVSSSGIIVKSKSMSKLPTKLLGSCSTNSVVKLNKSLTVFVCS